MSKTKITDPIVKITKAYVLRFKFPRGWLSGPTKPVTVARVEWIDEQGHRGRTEGDPKTPPMEALLARAKQEGIKILKKTW